MGRTPLNGEDLQLIASLARGLTHCGRSLPPRCPAEHSLLDQQNAFNDNRGLYAGSTGIGIHWLKIGLMFTAQH